MAVTAGDFNGDGKIDLVVAEQNTPGTTANCSAGTISILLGNGNGTFQFNVDYPCVGFPLSITVTDFNRGGALDLAVANGFGSTC